MTEFNEKVAMVAGVNAAIIAELIRKLTHIRSTMTYDEYGKKWARCSMKMATVYCPFLTVRQGAFHTLLDKGIIAKEHFNEDQFDHTNWYAFTEYGEALIKRAIPQS